MPPEENKSSPLKVIVWLLLIAVVAFGGYYAWSNNLFFGKGQVSTEDLRNSNQNFAQATDIIYNGGDQSQARTMLEAELQKAEETQNFREAGIIKFYIAQTQYSSSNDAATLAPYAKTFVEVATNNQYAFQTRSYAFAYLGEIFSRVLALNDSEANSVLDLILNDPFIGNYKITNTDGSVNYRESAIRMLAGIEKIRHPSEAPNPVMLTRLASLMVRSVELGEVTKAEDRQGRIAGAIEYVERAKNHEDVFQKADIARLYPSYLFLSAQVYGIASVIEKGKYASQVHSDVDAAYQKAITATTAGSSRGTEASARFNYAKYLVGKYNLKASHSAQEDATLQVLLDSIFQRFNDEKAIRSSAMFGIILNYTKNKTQDPVGYALVQDIAKHSPVFKEVISK